MNSLVFKNGTKIIWKRGLDGGGSEQYLDFLSLLESFKKTYVNGLEWCCGLGAIGYSLLDAKIVTNMTFVDIYEPAITYAYRNSSENNLENNVNGYCISNISNLPSNQKFDIVVANPPHCNENFIDNPNDIFLKRLIFDENWNIHKEFFSNIKNNLNYNADIFLSEVSFHESHIKMAEEGGLTFIDAYDSPLLSKTGSGNNYNSKIMHYKYI